LERERQGDFVREEGNEVMEVRFGDRGFRRGDVDFGEGNEAIEAPRIELRKRLAKGIA